MHMLSSNVDYPTSELAERLETSKRTIYRYIKSLKECGFVVGKRSSNTHKLIKKPIEEIDLKDLIMISSEEAFILHTLLLAITGDSQILYNLEMKLAALFDATSITEIIGNKTSAENVKILKKAINDMETVELVGYESGHTMKVSNRIVEPYAFSTNYTDVHAYEIATGLNKTFKISRIGWVKPLGVDWEHEDLHEVILPDCFRMNGNESIPVNLKMSLMAKNLLIEEYPLAMKDVTLENGTWWLKTMVKNLSGVSRFVIGLADQIEIIDSPELTYYIENFITLHFDKYLSNFNHNIK